MLFVGQFWGRIIADMYCKNFNQNRDWNIKLSKIFNCVSNDSCLKKIKKGADLLASPLAINN